MPKISKTTSGYLILRWMQEHPMKCYNTSASKICNEVCELPECKSGDIILQQQFGALVKQGAIHKIGKMNHMDYIINYSHERIPDGILDNAPASVKMSVVKRASQMADNQYMDAEGCIVTPNAVEKTEDPFAEDVKETPEKADIAEEDVKEIEEPTTEESSVTEKPTIQELAVPVQVKKDGKSMNITVNITLNL